MAERTRRHQEWLDYYRALAARYQDNSLYPTAGPAAWQTMDVIDDAPDIDAFKKTIWTGTLLLDHAKSLVRDRETARAAAYDAVGDAVRAHGARTILSSLDGIVDLPSLNDMLAAVREQTERAAAIDAVVDRVGDDLAALEDLEVWETAEVPEEWQDELADLAAAAYAAGVLRWRDEIAPAACQIWEGWSFDDREVWADRHRRRLPLPDAVVERRLEQHRRYRGEDGER